jgi:hypothetical protein
MNHEEALIRAFILPTRRERYLEALTRPKKRAKFRHKLGHFNALNPKFVLNILPSQQTPSSISQLLRAKGAGTKCWVISESTELDGRELDLEMVLEATIGRSMGTFVSCIPGKLAYFENEDGRWILER